MNTNQANVPIVGQPFTLVKVEIPVNATLTCNCGGDHTNVEIVASAPTACASCGKTYLPLFNMATGQLQIQISVPKTEGQPS